MIDRIARYYTGLAVVFFNTAVVFLGFNALLFGAFWLRDRGQGPIPARQDMVTEKYGDELLARAYPGMDATQIHALLQETWGWKQPFEAYVHFRESPRKGTYVNVHEAGFRLSADQGPWPPLPDSYNVFVFGGSTTFSYGLSDDQTVPSNLQRALAPRMSAPVHVYNFGVGSYQSTQERILFQELLIKAYRPRLAVFIDGLNDFAYPDVPSGTYVLGRLTRGAETPKRYEAVANWPIVQFAQGLKRRLTSGRENHQPNANGPSPSRTDQPNAATSTALLDAVIGRYLANKRQIEAVAHEFGVQPVFVWQPIPFYKYDNRYHLFSPKDPGINRDARNGYERLAAILKDEAAGADFVWSADIQERLREPLYVDSIHYTAAMSDRLARHIVGVLAERGLLCDRSS
jgi:lysophospholipase L1-like esterase